MPAKRLIPLPAATWTPVLASIIPRAVRITEDASTGTGSGLLVRYPEDNFTQAYQYSAAQQPVVIGDPLQSGAGFGMLLGVGPQPTHPATTLVQLQPAGAATVVRFEEYE